MHQYFLKAYTEKSLSSRLPPRKYSRKDGIAAACFKMILHTVLKGESFYSIAARYGVSVARLLADNEIADPDLPIVGQSLVILKPRRFYTVLQGDTPSSIAKKEGLSLRALYRNNPSLLENDTLYPGQTLVSSYEGQRLGRAESGGYAYTFLPPADFKKSLPYLSEANLFTYGFEGDGTLIPISPGDSPLLTEALHIGSTPILVLSTLGADGRFDSTRASALFSSPEAIDRLISSLLSVMGEKGYRGVDVDFEFIPLKDKNGFLSFVGTLRRRLNAQGYTVAVALAPKTYSAQPGLLYESHDYRALGNAADRLLLMTYEWGYAFGPPGPIAPIGNVERVIDYALTEIPKEKLLLGIPNYGYDWTLPYVKGNPRAVTLFPKDAHAIAARYGAEILFDEQAASPYFYYTDEQGRAHVVHFEDARSFDAKFRLLAQKGLAGFGVWTVMSPTPSLLLTANALFDLD